ncbi:MAG: lipoprotein-releasing ABC transporter permease subunit [Pseudomonadales bacterium]|nr:lipoprotein-releasing ABC transporter permease subunit [Pseudomonadales bacterium]
MNVAIYMGLRFSVSEKGSDYLSFITRVSMVGLAFGVTALIVVVSIMNGFDSQLKYRILGAVPHMQIKNSQLESMQQLEGVVAAAPFIDRAGIMVQSRSNRLVAVYGIVPEFEAEISVLPQHILQGNIDNLVAGSNNIIMGDSLANQLGLGLGDSISMLIPEPSKGGAGVVPKIARVELAGVFALQSELDYSLVLIHLEDLQKMVGDSQHNIRLTLENVFGVNQVKQQLPEQVLVVSDWTQDYGDFFETVRMEKLMMFLLLTLVVAIAAFNTISGLSMMVKAKQAQIAVLRTMGMSRLSIMGVFIVQGGVIGFVGTLGGIALGIPLAYNITEVIGLLEDISGSRMLAGTYFDRVPTDVRLADVLLIIVVSFAISIMATLYPAYRAANIEPSAALRTE